MSHQINLLPDYYLKQQYRKRVDLVFVVLFALMIFSIIAAERYSVRDTDSIRRRYDAVQGQFDESARTADEVYTRIGSKGQLIGKAKESISLLQMVPRSYLMGIITKYCPASLSLTAIMISDKVLDPQAGKSSRVVTVKSAANIKPPEKETFIDIEGTAANDSDVSDYVSLLKENPIFCEVSLKYTQGYSAKAASTSGRDEKTENKYAPAREFAITLKVNKDADIPELISQMREKDKASSAPASEPTGNGKEAGK